MKGFLMQRPVEYHIETGKEEWEQGDAIEGTLRLKNSSDENVDLNEIVLMLTYGVFKKIKAKEDDAWKEIDKVSLSGPIQLNPQEEKVFNWRFDLPTDCQITDNFGSIFLWYGDQNKESPGKLNFNIQLKSFLQSYIQTFEAQFQFQKKYEKSKGEYSEVKLLPPSTYTTLDYVLCFMRIHKNIMDIKYSFKIKTFGKDPKGNKLKVKSKKVELQQEINVDQYSMGGFPNRSCYQKSISEALEQTKVKSFF